MNKFGGSWTKTKIEMLVEYARAYLEIMKEHPYWIKLYFDGFAGTGFIKQDKAFGSELTIGAAKRIIEITDPISFDEYYFVEKVTKNAKLLEQNTKEQFPNKKIYIVREDCNKKLLDLGRFLRTSKGKNYKILAYLDPCGMQLEWKSIEQLKDLSLDIWVLIPTGMGANRLLTKDGSISEGFLRRLEIFLGINEDEIRKYFYSDEYMESLFGDSKMYFKEKKCIDKCGQLFIKKLKTVFKYVSEPLELQNQKKSPMYHLIFVSNNNTALKIANEIIKKYKNNG